MVAKKQRIRVVLDTNVFVRSFKSASKSSPNKRVLRLWLLERKLLPIVSSEIVGEYLEIFETVLALRKSTVDLWRRRLADPSRVHVVNLGRRFTESRDPDDNLMLAAAFTGRVDYLVTNDRDLLDLPAEARKRLPFEILDPVQLLGLMLSE